MIFFLFLFPLIVVSLNVPEDLSDIDVDIGQLDHDRRYLATVDTLLLFHLATVPARRSRSKMP